MKSITSILLLTLLVSCTSVSVTDPSVPKYAPKGYKGIGVIKYLNQGMDFIIQTRREDAFESMYNSCGGEYVILSEGNKPDYRHVAGNTMYETNYWYITYQCD